MKNSTFISPILILILMPALCFSQPPSIQWAKCFGGSSQDGAHSIQIADDLGFIIAGGASSTDGDITSIHSLGDVWVIKIDSVGNIEWQKCYGGSQPEYAFRISKRSAGGYYFAGKSLSDDGDVSGNHSSGIVDFWVVRLDDLGNIIWQRCFGGTMGDVGNNMDTTSDGGCIVVGNTKSNDGDVSGFHAIPGSSTDIWVIKVDSSGDLQWQRCLGGYADEEGWSVRQTNDNGYIVAGFAGSNDGDVFGNHGSFDFWFVKLDQAGNMLWQACHGGTGPEECYAVVQANDGGYVAVGATSSNDLEVSGNHGGIHDLWVVKVDSLGVFQWQKCFGGTDQEIAYNIEKTLDGGYVITGYTESNDGDVSGNHSNGPDAWIIKIDSAGNLQWQKCLGGYSWDFAQSTIQTRDSGYIMTGGTFSNDGDVSGNHGIVDVWVVKLAPIGLNTSESFVELIDLTACYSDDGSLVIKFISKKNGMASFKVYDVPGKLLFEKSIEAREGFNSVVLPFQQAKGISIVKLTGTIGAGVKKVVGF